MRLAVSCIFGAFVVALVIAAIISSRSDKPIGPTLKRLQIAFLIPLIGNMIIIMSGQYFYSLTGYYIYFIGMDIAVYRVLIFTMEYCELNWPIKYLKHLVWTLIVIDGIQYALNPFTHHAFTLQAIRAYGFNYYLNVTYAGQNYHRIICYGIFTIALLLSIYKLVKSPKIYRDRYLVLTVAMILSCLMETFYIFSRTPMNISMTAFATFGLLAFYLSLYYRPLKVLDRMLGNIISELNESIFFFDVSGKCLWANEPAMDLVNVTGKDYEVARERLVEEFGDYTNSGDSWAVKKFVSETQEPRFYNLELRALSDDKGRETGKFLRVRDNTDEQVKIQREIYSATHDRLTGLFTKEYLYELIGKTLNENPGKNYYIIFVDVNNFKIVNDVFGMDFGDQALREIAIWIEESSKKTWVYGRLGGDTFGALVPVEDFDQERVEKELTNFVVKDRNKEHHLLIHLGLYKVTEEKLDVSVMFDRAHLAINRIKEDYNTHIAYYDDNIRQSVVKEQLLATQISEAIETRQIIPYLQPIVDSHGTVLGAEALARWIHPTEGFLSPASFIPVLERNGMIADVDLHIWKCACEILKQWQEKGIDRFLSINISPKDFFFMNVPDTLIKLVKEYGISPKSLRVEITETAMIGDADSRMNDIQKLRDNGFIIEMDDFGSGYSSLNLLQDMPVDVLKIDMAFLRKAEDSQKAEMILYNIIAMAKDLEITSLTEGVESLYQFEHLSRMGCKLFQGYHFSKPLPLEEFEEYCRINAES